MATNTTYQPPDQRAQAAAEKDEKQKQMWMNMLKGAVMGSYLPDNVAKPLAGVGLLAGLLYAYNQHKHAKQNQNAADALNGGTTETGTGTDGTQSQGPATRYLTAGALGWKQTLPNANASANVYADQMMLDAANKNLAENPNSEFAQRLQQNAQTQMDGDNYVYPWMNQNQNYLGGLGQFQPQTGGGFTSQLFAAAQNPASTANARTPTASAATNPTLNAAASDVLVSMLPKEQQDFLNGNNQKIHL